MLILYVTQPIEHQIRPNMHFKVEASTINDLINWETFCTKTTKIYKIHEEVNASFAFMNFDNLWFKDELWSLFEKYNASSPNPPPSWVTCALIVVYFPLFSTNECVKMTLPLSPFCCIMGCAIRIHSQIGLSVYLCKLPWVKTK